jgi:hypothetical protein
MLQANSRPDRNGEKNKAYLKHASQYTTVSCLWLSFCDVTLGGLGVSGQPAATIFMEVHAENGHVWRSDILTAGLRL